MPGPDVGRIILEIISLERSLSNEGVTGERDGSTLVRVNDLSKTG